MHGEMRVHSATMTCGAVHSRDERSSQRGRAAVVAEQSTWPVSRRGRRAAATSPAGPAMLDPPDQRSRRRRHSHRREPQPRCRKARAWWRDEAGQPWSWFRTECSSARPGEGAGGSTDCSERRLRGDHCRPPFGTVSAGSRRRIGDPFASREHYPRREHTRNPFLAFLRDCTREHPRSPRYRSTGGFSMNS